MNIFFKVVSIYIERESCLLLKKILNFSLFKIELGLNVCSKMILCIPSIFSTMADNSTTLSPKNDGSTGNVPTKESNHHVVSSVIKSGIISHPNSVRILDSGASDHACLHSMFFFYHLQ